MSTGSTPICLKLLQVALQTAKSYLKMTNSLTYTHDVIRGHKSSSIFKIQALILHNLTTLFRTVYQKSFNTPHYTDCTLQVPAHQETAVARILMYRHLVYTPNCKTISHSNIFVYNEPTNA